MNFLLLTGIPRSGTTLACSLLDRLDGVVCLSEPDEHVKLMRQTGDAAEFAALLRDSIKATRMLLVEGKPTEARRSATGSVLTNYFLEPDRNGRRELAYSIEPRQRPTQPADVLVCSKHNALYTAALPQLVGSVAFRVIAIVRDPVAALRSWRSVQLPISMGRLPAAEKFWPEMRDLCAADIPLLVKQIRIYDLFCRRFIQHREDICVVRYEDLLEDCTPLVAGAGRTMSPAIDDEWRSMVDRKYVQQQADPTLRDAVREACAQKQAGALLSFYPDYG